MIAKFSPSPDSLIRRFKYRFEASQFIEFMPSTGSADSTDFGELMPDEFPVLRILPSSSSNACWMTTKRLMWADFEGKHEIQLTQLADATPRYFYSLQVAEDEALRIKTKDGHVYDIVMPDRGILGGMWDILARYARRSPQENSGVTLSSLV